MSGNQSYVGQRTPSSGTGPYNLMAFVFKTLAARMATCTLVQVTAVRPGAGLAPGTVDVQLLVDQADSSGNTTPHGTVYGLPFARVQAGAVALVIDPAVGDIGVAVFASRDISAAKAPDNVSKLAARKIKSVVPGSQRAFDYADGVYLFTALSATEPTDYVQMPAGGGLAFADRFGNSMTADGGGITINGVLIPRGGVSFNVKTHSHQQPNDSHGDVEQPTAAPMDGS